MLKGIKVILYILVVSLGLCCVQVASAIDDGEEMIPLPDNTEQVHQQTYDVAGSEMTSVFYESDLAPSQVRNFYTRFLTEAGWSQNNPMAFIENMPGVKMEKGAKKIMQDMLTFEKDNETLTVVFVPSRTSADKKTQYSLSRCKRDMNVQKPSLNMMDYFPRLLDKPQKEPAPVYPGAALIALSEGDDFLRASYVTRDGMQGVENFFNNNMGRYGWRLLEAVPESRMQSSREEDIAKYCPECAKKGINARTADIQRKELMFVGDQGDKCAVALFEMNIPGGGPMAPATFTQILIDYEKGQ